MMFGGFSSVELLITLMTKAVVKSIESIYTDESVWLPIIDALCSLPFLI